MTVLLSEPEAWRFRVFLPQSPRDYARDRQDRLSLRRTVQLRKPTPCACPARGASACAARGTPILFVLAVLRSVPHRKRHLRQAGSQFRGLATAIHKISGLGEWAFWGGLSESAELIRLDSIVAGQIATRFAMVPAVSFWQHYFIRGVYSNAPGDGFVRPRGYGFNSH
jgi:hypothetical protein